MLIPLISVYLEYTYLELVVCWVSWPKIKVTAQWDRAKQTQTCQDEGARSREKTEKRHGGAVPRGTVVPRVLFWRKLVAARACLNV